VPLQLETTVESLKAELARLKDELKRHEEKEEAVRCAAVGQRWMLCIVVGKIV
jgi:hypothetical protein